MSSASSVPMSADQNPSPWTSGWPSDRRAGDHAFAVAAGAWAAARSVASERAAAATASAVTLTARKNRCIALLLPALDRGSLAGSFLEKRCRRKSHLGSLERTRLATCSGSARGLGTYGVAANQYEQHAYTTG